MRGARREGSSGFVLAATLWVLAGLAVLAAYIDGVVASDVERAIMAGRSLESELERRSTEATLIYLLATGRMNHHGLILEEEQRFSGSLAGMEDEHLPDHGDGELRVRGEVYAGLGGTRFSLQDEWGLASVNVPDFPLLAVLLRRAGLAEVEVQRVLARVEDYIDADEDLTVNGAEHYDYRRHGMPPPADWIMASPWELKKVLGVDALITPAPMAPAVASAYGSPGVWLQFRHDAARAPGRRARSRRTGAAQGARGTGATSDIAAGPDSHVEREASRRRRRGAARASFTFREGLHLA